MCVLLWCPSSVSSSMVAVSDAASCMKVAASSSCASAGPSEPTAPTQAQHVARWIDVAEIPTWARRRLRGSSDCHSVRKHLLCVHMHQTVCVE